MPWTLCHPRGCVRTMRTVNALPAFRSPVTSPLCPTVSACAPGAAQTRMPRTTIVTAAILRIAGAILTGAEGRGNRERPRRDLS